MDSGIILLDIVLCIAVSKTFLHPLNGTFINVSSGIEIIHCLYADKQHTESTCSAYIVGCDTARIISSIIAHYHKHVITRFIDVAIIIIRDSNNIRFCFKSNGIAKIIVISINKIKMSPLYTK